MVRRRSPGGAAANEKLSTGLTSSSGTGAASEKGARPETDRDDMRGPAGQRTSPAAGEHCRAVSCHHRSPSTTRRPPSGSSVPADAGVSRTASESDSGARNVR